MGQRVVEPARHFALIDQAGGAGGHEQIGILALMIARGTGIRKQDCRYAADGQLGQRRTAGTADRQIGSGQPARQVVEERNDAGGDAQFFVKRRGRSAVALAGLMQNLPTAEHRLGLVDRRRNMLVQRAGAAAAAQHQQSRLMLAAGCVGREPVTQEFAPHRSAGRADAAARPEMRTDFGKRGTNQLGTAGQPTRGLAGKGVLFEQHIRNIERLGRAGGGGTGVSAESDNERHAFGSQKSPGGVIARHVVGQK